MMGPWDFKCTLTQFRKLMLRSKRGKRHIDFADALDCRRMKPFPAIYYYRQKGDRQRIRPCIDSLLSISAGAFHEKVRIALGEAVSNALTYGTVVRIRLNKIGHHLILRVKDDGPGFAGNQRIEILAEEEGSIFERYLYEESGRGMAIMTAWMDLVRYNRRGNEVMMIKNCAEKNAH